jgi:sulfatase maturation enzyme AslB (radical SAM superfamily)
MPGDVAAALNHAARALRRLERALAPRAAPGAGRLRMLGVAVSSACNLNCWYCSQNDGGAVRMDWEVLRCALDRLLASGHPQGELCLYGGEPLLEPALLGRAVDHLRRRHRPGVRVRLSISTNGTRLDGAAATFLAANGVRTQLSFDGVLEAQDQRAPGTFAALDRLLLRLRREHRAFFDHLLTVHITLTSRNLPHLAESVRYFLRRGVPRISIAPLATHDEGWRPTMREELHRQTRAALDLCLAHRRRTGELTVTSFRPFWRARTPSPRNMPMCGVHAGDRAVVGADGTAFACAALVGMARPAGAGLLGEAVDLLRLGPVADRAFPANLAALPARLRGSALFGDKERKRSSYARCGECRFIAECMICPVSIAAIPGNDDPNRVPDLPCAWNLAAGACREVLSMAPVAGPARRGRTSATK